MGYRFHHQIKVAVDPNKPLKIRRWAIWRCSSLISNLTLCISTKEVYSLVSKKIGFCSDKDPSTNRLPSEEQIIKSMLLLIQIRFRVTHILRLYENNRRKVKTQGKRFPVLTAFQKEDVASIINSSTSSV